VDVEINRPNFIFNPTSCNELAITGTLSSGEGAPVVVLGSVRGRQLLAPSVQADVLGRDEG